MMLYFLARYSKYPSNIRAVVRLGMGVSRFNPAVTLISIGVIGEVTPAGGMRTKNDEEREE